MKSQSLKKSVQERREVVVLIVINDERNLSLTKIILERGLPECKILATNNTLNAINTLVSREVSLVILDADYNGIDMLRRIRDDEKFKDVSVMMMSLFARCEGLHHQTFRAEKSRRQSQQNFERQRIRRNSRRRNSIKDGVQYPAYRRRYF